MPLGISIVFSIFSRVFHLPWQCVHLSITRWPVPLQVGHARACSITPNTVCTRSLTCPCPLQVSQVLVSPPRPLQWWQVVVRSNSILRVPPRIASSSDILSLISISSPISARGRDDRHPPPIPPPKNDEKISPRSPASNHPWNPHPKPPNHPHCPWLSIVTWRS